VRQEIVVLDFSSYICSLKGIPCPQVTEADHVGGIVIDLIGCRDISFKTEVLGYSGAVASVIGSCVVESHISCGRGTIQYARVIGKTSEDLLRYHHDESNIGNLVCNTVIKQLILICFVEQWDSQNQYPPARLPWDRMQGWSTASCKYQA